jgi:hypothetical protein
LQNLARRIKLSKAMLHALLLSSVLVTAHAEGRPYSFDALFVEGCSCSNVCVTEITGFDAKCHGLAGMRFDKGRFEGHNMSGARAAWVFAPGKVLLYIDAPEAKFGPTKDFLTAALADWGQLVQTKSAHIDVAERAGQCVVTVDAGKTGSLAVSAVTGKNGLPVEHSHLASLFHDSLYQGQTTSASYGTPGSEDTTIAAFTLKGTNGFFYPHCHMKGLFK